MAVDTPRGCVTHPQIDGGRSSPNNQGGHYDVSFIRLKFGAVVRSFVELPIILFLGATISLYPSSPLISARLLGSLPIPLPGYS